MKRQILTTAILATLTIGGVGTLAAGEPATPEVVPQKGLMTLDSAPEVNAAFGPNDVWTSIGAPQFMPRSGTLPPSYYVHGYVYPDTADDGLAYYWAQLYLPNGAEVKSMYMPVYDNDASGYVRIQLWGSQAYSRFLTWGDDTPESKLFGEASTGTTETPGHTNLTVTPTEPLVIREYTDFDGDGSGNTFFYIRVVTSRDAATADTDIRFFGAAVNWTRTISPAPATATFNDVPTGHWAFQYIESLANSGITSGCDASNFCPDDTLTRAQMAVFLAKALGLHWST
jgi:hypothetical protein